MADSSEPIEEVDPAGSNDSSDVGSWLTALGAPESLTNMIPRDLREFDVSSVLRLLGGMGSIADDSSESPVQSSSELEGAATPAMNQASDRSIRWLPVLRG